MSRRRSSSRRAVLPEPRPWGNGPLVLYHGTGDALTADIRRRIDVRRGRVNVDFGRGFYTTTSLRAAQVWANDLVTSFPMRRLHLRPVVIRFDVDRERLVQLDGLCFARGDAGADDFWSFVRH